MYLIVKGVKAKIKKSNRKNKKLVAEFDYKGNHRKIHFGDSRYKHYKDLTGFYSQLDHLDEDRRNNYKKRHSKIYLKSGRLAYKDPRSPAFWSYNVLW